jgi:pyruvyl transferase EpsO
LVKRLQETIDATLKPLIPRGSTVAHVAYPDHWNAGDPAIWLGEKAALERLGAQVAYECKWQEYNRDVMAERIGEGLILIAGGGNLGDLWPNHQLFRERILKDFPNNRIVQFPQGICFEDERNLDRFREFSERHGQYHLLLRDQQSMGFAAQHLDVPVTLCPDMAFSLGKLTRPASPVHDIVWLARTDKESLGRGAYPAHDGIEVSDWLNLTAEDEPDRAAVKQLSDRCQQLYRQLESGAADDSAVVRQRSELNEEIAWIRVRRGLRMLSAGRVVMTDRLHGHILSLSMGIPHVVMDNSYGKISSTWNTWTKSCQCGVWADSVEYALAAANRLVAR